MEKRLSEIQGMCSQPLIVLKTMEGEKADEQWVHYYLKTELGCRIEGRREWYLPTASLLDWINSPISKFPEAS